MFNNSNDNDVLNKEQIDDIFARYSWESPQTKNIIKIPKNSKKIILLIKKVLKINKKSKIKG
jgi:hypothetical protein